MNAAYGFAMVLEKMLEQYKPTYMAVAWDLPGKTFRHEAFEAYKAQREEKEQELYDQIPIIQEILEAFGIPSLSAAGYEADDVIATLSTKAGKKGLHTYVVTGDLDSIQLVDEDTTVVFFVKGLSETKHYDIPAVKERYGLTPKETIDYKALRGDPSDNIPGVAGIGDKTATILVQDHGSIDGIKKALKEEKIPEKFAKKLRGQEKVMDESLFLVQLEHKVPLTFKFSDAKVKKPDLEAILQIYRDLEFRTLLRKHAKDIPPPPPPKKKGAERIVQVVRDLEDLTTSLGDLSEDALGVLAVEQPEDLFGATLSGIAISDGKQTLVVQNPQKDHLLAIEETLKKAAIVFSHDVKQLMHQTDWRPLASYFDVMLASYLLHSGSRAHDLASIAYEHLGAKTADVPEFCSTEKECKILGEIVSLLPEMGAKVRKELENEGSKKVFDQIEMPLVPVLADMENIGIELDVKALEVFQKELKKDLSALTKKITKLAGEEFNLNSPSQLAVILFEKLELSTKGIKKTQKGFSTAASELEKLEGTHDIIPLISEYRELEKLRSTYVETLPHLVGPDGRIHTSFNQTVAATGRLSSSNPNLQNIPIKTPLGNKIREAFVASKGKVLIAADYSQIELRLAAVIAKDKPFIQAFQDGADIHTRTAAEILGLKEEEVTKVQRYAAKAINFGILYGMGPKALARQTGLSFGEAKEFIAKYFEIHKAIRNYIDDTKAEAHENEFVETLFGRRRYLPEISTGVPPLVAAAERMAINMPVQGTAADIMKKAMIAVDGWLKTSKWDAKMLLQVHDEIVLEVEKDAIDVVAKGLRSLMEGVAAYEVPLVVDVEVGDRWGTMKKWEG